MIMKLKFKLEVFCNDLFLSGRHYSPKLKRFISPDKVDNLIYNVEDLVQLNLFSYCDNNPIMRKDNNGQRRVSSYM